MVSSIQFIPARELKKRIPAHDTAVISIHDSDSPIAAGIPTLGWGLFEDVGFDDAAYNIEQMKTYGSEFWTYFDGCASKVHALKILVAFKRINESHDIEHIIVQCDAGVSRSAAVAKFYAEKYNLELEGDTTRANSLVTQLLQNPSFFDDALDTYVNTDKNGKPKASDGKEDSDTGWINKILEMISVILFGKRI